MNIKERVVSLAKTTFNQNFEDYLSENKRELIVCRIDQSERTIQLHQQPPNANFDPTRLTYVESHAGYCVGYKERNDYYDILLLSDAMLSASAYELETIIIHELAHWLIDSGNVAKLKISDEAVELGNNISNLLHPDDTIHDIAFCQTLAQACITYNKKEGKFGSALDAISSAMRFDLYQ